MKRIGLLSDTHGLADPLILKAMAQVDEIWHAGDIGNVRVIELLSAIAPVRAVYGNIDDQEIRKLFPADLNFTVEGIKIWMTHIGGYPGRYPPSILERLQREKPGLFICGHSHILKVQFDHENDLLHINPGAAGKHGLHNMRTVVRFHISGGRVSDLEVVELGLRGELS